MIAGPARKTATRGKRFPMLIKKIFITILKKQSLDQNN